MIIIVDTNIIISACLESSGELYQILTTTSNNIEFATPDFALREIVHHQARICLKSKKSILLFQHNLSALLDNLLVLPNEDLSAQNIIEAENFTAIIDIDDTIFVAFAIGVGFTLMDRWPKTLQSTTAKSIYKRDPH